MEYAIYQVKNTNPDGRMFMNTDWLAQNGLKVTKDSYDRVYSGEVESFEPLGYLWKKFNMAHPDDYRGRSLSVSDVVVLTDKEGTRAFFCDSIGWTEAPEFLGNFVDEVSNDEIVSGPDDGNTWGGEECGAEAEMLECQRIYITDGEIGGELYMPTTPRGCAFWIAKGMTAAKYIPIVPDERGIPCLSIDGKVFYLADIYNA